MDGSPLSFMEQMSAEMGFPPQRREVDGPYPCPTHGVMLRTAQVGTFAGWYESTWCPDFDGTCGYDPNAAAAHIDVPTQVVEEERAAAAAEREAAMAGAKVHQMGNGVSLVEVAPAAAGLGGGDDEVDDVD